MNKEILLENLATLELKASSSRFHKLFTTSYKYIHALAFRELVYKRKRKEKKVIADSFFGVKMELLLPSSTDIYLLGGKSHLSEIRLAKFMVNNIQSGQTFVDVGAHYGYFTLLGSTLVDVSGRVYAFEAAPKSYNILLENTQSILNTESFNLAVSDNNAELIFYEFPNLYSEYNTIYPDQFKDEDWITSYPPKKVAVDSIRLDDFFMENSIVPDMIKIDVEGAEQLVINGSLKYLVQHAPLIIMEYLEESRANSEHKLAETKLNALGYQAHRIDQSGEIKILKSASKYLEENNLDSDNIVFKKI